MPNTHSAAEPAGPALDLSSAGVDAAWSRMRLLPAIRVMESQESWAVDRAVTADGRSVESALESFAQEVSGVSRVSIAAAVGRLGKEIIRLMGQLRSGRALLMLRWLDGTHESVGASLLKQSASNPDGGDILLERLSMIQRQQLMGAIFAPERIATLLDILDEFNDAQGATQ